MKLYDVVENNHVAGKYGTVEYSTFGFSIHYIADDGTLSKSLGYPARELLKNWTVVEMPEGFERGEYGGIKKAVIKPESSLKWAAMLKAFDMKMAGEWHSGSCTAHRGQTGLNTKEEAVAWLEKMAEERYGNKERYQLTPCILCYDENGSENLDVFFKLLN